MTPSGRVSKLPGKPRVLCVIQARMGSSRLPGKVLQDLGGMPMLEFMLARVDGIAADHLVVATSDRDLDTPIVELVQGLGIDVVRGSESDVLGRFITALDAYPSDIVVRLTADCPLTDPAIVNDVIALHVERGAHYTSNVLPRSFPKGLDVEVCDATALRTAGFLAIDAAEREHVTPFLYRQPEHFTLANLDSGFDAGTEWWTVDTAADLERVRGIVTEIGALAPWTEILATIGRHAPSPLPGAVALRSVRADDVEGLLVWRNDPEAIRWSTSQTAVSEQVHQRWFASMINNPAHRLRIGTVDGAAVGFVRVDVRAGVGTISIAVGAEHRGKSFGKALLALIADDVRQDCQVRELVASVHRDNEVSLAAFAGVGFDVVGENEHGFCTLIRAA